MINAIVEQTGTPQDPVDWTNPDQWIGERLSGKDRDLAERTWAAKVNPRHSYGAYLFINSNGLLRIDGGGIYRITEDGGRFLKKDAGILRKLDQSEGIPDLLPFSLPTLLPNEETLLKIGGRSSIRVQNSELPPRSRILCGGDCSIWLSADSSFGRRIPTKSLPKARSMPHTGRARRQRE